jgi:hypothetical protein
MVCEAAMRQEKGELLVLPYDTAAINVRAVGTAAVLIGLSVTVLDR